MNVSDLTFDQLLALIKAGVKEAISEPAAPAVQPSIAAEVNHDFGLVDLNDNATSEVASDQTAAQIAALDAVDPHFNVYSRLARKWTADVFNPIWSAERDRLLTAGHSKGQATNQLAAANIRARVKLEKARLAARDGSGKDRAPVVDPNKIRSIGTHSDPTANKAIAAVDRETALENEVAELKRKLAIFLGEESPEPITLNGVEAPAPASVNVPTRSAASLAQTRVDANPYQRTIDKLVRDAQASPNAAKFVNQWFKEKSEGKGVGQTKILRKQALAAAEALGLRVK